MTVAQWVPGHCPQCRAVNTVELDSSTRICLECRCEWDPVTVVEPFTPPLAAVPDQVEDDGTPPGVVILGTPAEREEPSSATVELLAPPP